MLGNLIKNTSIYVSIGFLNQALVSLVWIILAWWLDPSQIGIYFLAMFLVEFFTIVGMFGMDAALGRFYYLKKEKNKSVIFSNVFFEFLFFLIPVLIIFLISSKIIPYFIPEFFFIFQNYIFIIFLIIAADSVMNVLLVHYVYSKEAFSYGKLQMARTVSFCLLSLLFVKMGLGVPGLFYAYFASAFPIIGYFFATRRNIINPKYISPDLMKSLFSFAFPLVIFNIVGIIAGYSGRLLLNRYEDLAILGIYGFFLALVMRINGLWSSFNRAWNPELFSKFLDNENSAVKNAQTMAIFSNFIYLLGASVFIWIGELGAFKFFFKPDYLADIRIFYILLLAPVPISINCIFSPVYYFSNKMKRYSAVSIALSVINIFFTFYMVRNFGGIGAAMSYFSISAFTTLSFLLVYRKTSAIPSKIILWTFFISLALFLNIILLLKTSFMPAFLILILALAFSAYKAGGLGRLKYPIFNFIRKYI